MWEEVKRVGDKGACPQIQSKKKYIYCTNLNNWLEDDNKYISGKWTPR
jgi:hypothetical protein